jgi:hypothetical protein
MASMMVLAGCSSCTTPASRPPPTTEHAPTSSADDACARVAQRIAELRPRVDALGPPADVANRVILDGCLRGPGGAWWIGPTTWSDETSEDDEGSAAHARLRVQIEIGFVDDRGRAMTADLEALELPTALTVGVPSIDGAQQVHRASVHDFDRDGRAELALELEEAAHEGGRMPSTLILTRIDDAIDFFEPGEALRVEDVDRDGLLDLVTVGPYGFWGEPSDSFEAPTQPLGGPYLLHHGTATGLSTTDTVATRFVASECGTQWRESLVLDGASRSPLVPEAIAQRVVCARLCGTPTDEARARLRAELARLPPPGEDEPEPPSLDSPRIVRALEVELHTQLTCP